MDIGIDRGDPIGFDALRKKVFVSMFCLVLVFVDFSTSRSISCVVVVAVVFTFSVVFLLAFTPKT